MNARVYILIGTNKEGLKWVDGVFASKKLANKKIADHDGQGFTFEIETKQLRGK